MTYDFSAELAKISNSHLRELVAGYMTEAVPSYFWEIGASSSGKYHPCFSQGDGGLVRHTRAVVMFLDELMRMSSYAYMRQEYKDYAYAAAIMHDTCKYGVREFDKTQYRAHDVVAAEHFAEYCIERGETAPELLLMAMRSHMGQWASDPSYKPFTSIDRAVHMADYMASRSFIDIPSLHEDKNYSYEDDDGVKHYHIAVAPRKVKTYPYEDENGVMHYHIDGDLPI